MSNTSVTLDDIIQNLEIALSEGHLMGASRITINNNDLMSLLLAIQNELEKKLDAEPPVN